MQRKLNPRVKRFLAYLEGEALLDPVRAAELAGYARPPETSRKLMKTWADKVAEVESRLRSRVTLSSEQVLQRLSVVGQDVEHKDHVRALEILARIYGMMSDKLDIRVSRHDVSAHLSRALERIERAELPAPGAIPLAIGDGTESAS
jgi:hypothetical protein